MSKDPRFRWSEVNPVEVSIDEINDLLESVSHKKGYRIKKTGYGAKKILVMKTYQFIEKDNYLELRICRNYGVYEKYICRKCFDCDELKKESGISGMDAYNYVQDLFQDFHNTDITLYRAFSGQKYISEYKMIKNCVPKQIAFMAPVAKNRIINKAYKADVSSAFPSQMTKTLPSLHNCQVLNGIHEPSVEYPFAFYTKSGHIKIFNELDTHSMKNRYYSFYYDVYNDDVKAENEVTILCKASEYSMKEEFEYMYSKRKEDVNQKMYMNACIGFFHRNADPRLSHLAAVVIARNNQEMLNRVNDLLKENNIILYIATDSIVWRGNYSKIASTEKYLGSFTYEGFDGEFFGRIIGAYQYRDSDNYCIKCSYLENNEEKNNIPFGKLPEPKHENKFVVSRSLDGIKVINILGDN